MIRFSAELNDYISSEFARQRESGWIRAAGADAPEAMLLWGTLGYAAFLSADGRVWIERDAFDNPSVREATTQESIGVFVKASERHALFSQMIPMRPADARSCAECGGNGRIPFTDTKGADSPIWCGECEGLGWFLGDAGQRSV